MKAGREHVDRAKPEVDNRLKPQSHRSPEPQPARGAAFRGDLPVGISPESTPAQLLYLQRMAGNQAVLGVLGSQPTTVQRKPSLNGLKKTFGLGKKKKHVAGTAGPGAQGVLPKSLVGSPPNAAAAKTQVAGILSFSAVGDAAGSTSRLSSKTVAALADEADEAGSGEESPALTALTPDPTSVTAPPTAFTAPPTALTTAPRPVTPRPAPAMVQPPLTATGKESSTGSGSASSSGESSDTSSEDASIASWTESEAEAPEAVHTMFSRDRAYRDEFYKGTADVGKFLSSAEDATRQGTSSSVDEWMMKFAGWSKADCDKYLGKDAPTPMVTSLSTAGRATYEIKGGGSMTQGDSKEPFDTSEMFSKVKGSGFGIYVMDGRHRMYAGHHKVGIFHHSSFLAGGDVAGAGELKVVGGVLKAITNKSGHYKPDIYGLHQVLEALQNRGVDMSSVELFVFKPYDDNPPPFYGGVPRFLKEPEAPAAAPPPVVAPRLNTSDKRRAPRPRYAVSGSESSSSSEDSRYSTRARIAAMAAAQDSGSASSSSSEESGYPGPAALAAMAAAQDSGSASSSSSEESGYPGPAALAAMAAAQDSGSASSTSSEESGYPASAAFAAMAAAQDSGSDSSSSSEESGYPAPAAFAAMAAAQDSGSASSSSSEESGYPASAAFAAMAAAQDSGSASSSSSEESGYPASAAFAAMAAAQDSGSASSSSSEESGYPAPAAFAAMAAAQDSGSASSSSSEESGYPAPAAFAAMATAQDSGSDSSTSSEEGPTSGSTSAVRAAAVPPVALTPPVPSGPKYAKTRSRDIRYGHEFTSGSSELRSLIEKTQDAKKSGQIKSVSGSFQKNMGWTEEETHKYLRKGAPLPMVTKLGTRGRAALELKGGSPMTQGDSKDPYDTSSLVSNFMGRGYAIYVMDGHGNLYASQHKVGIFHHSSFLAGGDVTGAGEIKIERGAVKAITNKSGHYLPTSEEMVQVFEELEARGVNLSAVEYIPMGTPDAFGLRGKDPYPGGARKFLADQRAGAISGA